MVILKLFEHILNSITDASSGKTIPNINPTEIYNEGWMTRLMVYLSVKNKIKIDKLIDFEKINNWSSEGLISSPFINAGKNREGYTHADIALGDFSIDYKDRGEIKIPANASTFGIIEAKMGSNLSKGTTHAPNYNQASRNLACIAKNVKNKTCNTFFVVAAPERIIEHHKIKEQVEKGLMIEQIKARFKLSGIPIDNENINIAEKCNTDVISYEQWINLLPNSEKEMTLEFYNKCLVWNRIK